MDIQEKFTHWLNLSQYDLDSATNMFNSGRWLYVAFMRQQAIEKLVKGIHILLVGDNFPRIHEIQKIVKLFEDKLKEPVSEERYQFMAEISSYYLNIRYVDYKQTINK
jgi:HEPN domain-containing protein